MTASASAHHQIFRVLIGPERGPLSLLCNDVDTPSHFIVGNVRVSSHHRSTKRRSVSRGKRKYKTGLIFFFSSPSIPIILSPNTQSHQYVKDVRSYNIKKFDISSNFKHNSHRLPTWLNLSTSSSAAPTSTLGVSLEKSPTLAVSAPSRLATATMAQSQTSSSRTTSLTPRCGWVPTPSYLHTSRLPARIFRMFSTSTPTSSLVSR
jgi:hypothetical protein